MPSTGIRRKVDDLGRIVIPAGIRRTLDITEGDALEVSVDGDKVVLAKPSDRCVFCGGDDDLAAFRSRMVCQPCVAGVGAMDDARRSGGPAPAHTPETPAHAPTAPQAPAGLTAVHGAAAPVRDLRPAPLPDERVAGVRDERLSAYDPASSTAW